MKGFSSLGGRHSGQSVKCSGGARPSVLGASSGLQVALIVAMLAGCGHARGTFDSGVFQGPETRYALGTLPDGWRQVSVERQSDLAWAHESHAAVMHVDSGCSRGMDVPLTALTNHLLIGFTEREVVSEELVPMDDREALRTHVKAKLDGVPRELLIQVLKKDACVYDFALVAPEGPPFEAATADFDVLVNGFQTEKR